MSSLPKYSSWLLVIAVMITSKLSIGTYSGSAPLSPNITARSVACPLPVSESDP